MSVAAGSRSPGKPGNPGRTSLGRYGGQAAFAAVCLALALATAAIAAAGAWAGRELAAQWERYGAYRDLQRNAGRADSLSAAYEALGRDLEALRAALPAGNPSSHALNLLVEEAKSRGLGISGITALDEVPFPGYAELPFDVGLSGSFPAVVRYLHALETRGLAVQIRRLSVLNETLNQARVQARVELSVLAPGRGGAP